MGFWIFMLIMNLLIPGVMLGFGWVFLHKPPKTINYGYGYRTAMSTKSQETWDFAHQYAGRLWFQWGKWLLLSSVVIMLFLLGKDKDTIGNVGAVLCMLQLVPMLAVIGPTESALKKHFDANGRRKMQ
ncbi:MAG: SdpI family protein [Lachnospiraceae bacterium]|nr:SdpI family protein [Lachnospiraceae bacterium]